jgi:hypothetical protein
MKNTRLCRFFNPLRRWLPYTFPFLPPSSLFALGMVPSKTFTRQSEIENYLRAQSAERFYYLTAIYFLHNPFLYSLTQNYRALNF